MIETKQKVVEKQEVLDAVKVESCPILKLKNLKSQNRVTEHAKAVTDLIDLYGSKRKAAKALGLHYRTFHNLCKPPQRNVVTSRQESLRPGKMM